MTQERTDGNILGDEDLNALNDALAVGDDVQTLINQAKVAELDLGDREAQLQELQRKARLTKQAFFPGR